MKIDQEYYENAKRSVRGFYFKFNQQVLKWHMNKMFNYEMLLETAKDYDSFEVFYNFHTLGKFDRINLHLDKMYREAEKKGLKPTKKLVRDCLIVRLGNIYTGMYIENKILETFMNLSDYVNCEKTSKKIDTDYKVDAIVELVGVDKLGIQIKPISFTKYDNGSEIRYHNQFTLEFGQSVYYVFYKDRDTISFNSVDIKLNDKGKIVEQIEEILVYSS